MNVLFIKSLFRYVHLRELLINYLHQREVSKREKYSFAGINERIMNSL